MIRPLGPSTAKVLVVADFPSVEAERRSSVFSGPEGELFAKMLHEAGLVFSELRLMYICPFRPYATQQKYVWTKEKKEIEFLGEYEARQGAYYSKRLLETAKLVDDEIARLQPNIVITLGEIPLHYFTGETSVSKWRGSLMFGRGVKLIPTYSPTQIFRVWEWRPLAVRDLSRVPAQAKFPEIPAAKASYLIRPTFEQSREYLCGQLARLDSATAPVPLACDIETIARHIACVGFADSKHNAICIPIMDAAGAHYFSLEEEVEISWLIRQVLCHPNCELVGQNFSYDTQHFVRHWGFRPTIGFDTMLAQHVCFPGTPKDLAMLASLYCENYVYWKDELKDYNKMPDDVNQFWTYNCKDNCYTFEVYENLKELVLRLGFSEQFAFLQRLNHHVITMMIRGVRIDRQMKDRLFGELLEAHNVRVAAIHEIVGHPINIDSPLQMQKFFYGDLQLKPVLHKKTHRPTTDEGALSEIGQRDAILRPLTDLITETRSIGVFNSTFIQMPLDHDKRMRCSFNVGGAETFRFSSSGDAFGSGGNLQNIPKGNEEEDLDEGAFVFPNVRRLFLPDPGMTLFDVDLAGADAQVVAWEAEDDDLKAKFRAGVKIHAENAKDIYGRDAGPDGKRKPYYAKAKMGCHLTNYGGKARTLSKALGMTIHEAEWFQRRWFSMHPGIKRWHDEVENSLLTTRSVRNKFGFRRFYFDRIDGLLPQALAWIPQSTVALVINHGLVKISECGYPIELLLQVHDSLVGQYPTEREPTILPIIRDCLRTPVPYSDPLIISTSLDLSTKSWGDLIAKSWNDVK